MRNYLLRKNCKVHHVDENNNVRAAVAFKTNNADWLAERSPAIVLVSIHSAFNEDLDGHLKMNALVSIIKNNIQGSVTILFSDKAHLKAKSLDYPDVESAFESILSDAWKLHSRFKKYFEGCKIAYWHKYICGDQHYHSFSRFIKKMYEEDIEFRYCLMTDAERVYAAVNPDNAKPLFLKMTIEDILEQCVCILVLSKKGYRFQFYPGKPYLSIDYVIEKILTHPDRIEWVNVFISIEKKTFINEAVAMENQRKTLEGW